MDTFVYMYTHAVVWLNYIGASRRTANGLGQLQRNDRFNVPTVVYQEKLKIRRKPDGRYVDHMHTL